MFFFLLIRLYIIGWLFSSSTNAFSLYFLMEFFFPDISFCKKKFNLHIVLSVVFLHRQNYRIGIKNKTIYIYMCVCVCVCVCVCAHSKSIFSRVYIFFTWLERTTFLVNIWLAILKTTHFISFLKWKKFYRCRSTAGRPPQILAITWILLFCLLFSYNLLQPFNICKIQATT